MFVLFLFSNMYMANKIAYLYVLDTLADWEPGYVISELNTGRYFKKDATRYSVKTFSINRQPITTMGGVQIVPELSIEEVQSKNAGVLILPGSDLWREPKHQPVFELVRNFLSKNILVGAICGATVALANSGILNSYKHTSNDLNFLLQTCPNYKGRDNYMSQPVVMDRNLITASGMAPFQFAKQILDYLEVFSPATMQAWSNLHETMKPEYFMELMQSLPGQG